MNRLKIIANKIPNQLSTLIDQCIVSGSSFFVNVLLVSFLGMELFGIFSFIWLAVLFIAGLQQSIIIMPMYTLSSKSADRGSYLGEVLRLQNYLTVLSIIACLVLFLILHFWSLLSLTQGLLSAVVVGLFIHQDFLRRVLFVVDQPAKVIVIDLLGFGSLPFIIALLYLLGLLNLDSLLISIVVTKGISTILGLHYVRPFVHPAKTIQQTLVRHWNYAKFLFASSLLQWFSGNIFILLSGLFIGPIALGALRAAQNILGLLNIFLLFLENSIPIKAAHVLHHDGKKEFNAYIVKITKQHFLVLLSFLGIIYLFRNELIATFYGAEMTSFEWLIPAFCGLYVLIFLGTIARFVYRTIEKNEVLFYGYVTSSLLGLAISYPLIQHTGLFGVVIGLFVTQIASLLTYLLHFKLSK